MTDNSIRPSINALTEIYVEECMSKSQSSDKAKKLHADAKRRSIQKFLIWLHKHWFVLHRKRTMNLIGRLNAAYDSGDDDLVGVIIGELTDEIKKIDNEKAR